MIYIYYDNSEFVQSIRVDKTLMFMLLFCISNTTKNIMVNLIDVNNSCIIEGLKADYSLFMGMFFIEDHQRRQIIKKHNDNNNGENNSNINTSSLDNTPFCLIFMDRIAFFKIYVAIQSSTQKPHYILKQTTVIRFASGVMIDFYYCPKYMILCCEKNEESFAFFNLSKEMYYSETYSVKLSLEKKEKIRKETFSNQSKIEKKRNYKTTQFFLEVIYNKLCFICLNLYEGKIIVYHVKNLNNLEINSEIMIQAKHATLQFIDNMIILHDFGKEESSIFDIKLKNKDKKKNYLYYASFPMTNHHLYQQMKMIEKNYLSCRIILSDKNNNNNNDDNSNNNDYLVRIKLDYYPIQAITKTETKGELDNNNNHCISMTNYAYNTFIYNKEIIVNGAVLEELRDITKDSSKNRMVYQIYFDPEIFYHSLKNSSDNIIQIFYLFRRKKVNHIILQVLLDMIIKGNQISIIDCIFSHIINCLWKKSDKAQILIKQKQQQQSQLQPQFKSQASSILEAFQLPEISFYSSSEDTIIKQSDVYSLLINNLEYNPDICPIYILTLLIHFTKELLSINIPLEDSIMIAMLSSIKKVKELSKIRIFFQYKSILDFKELAMFLIEKSNNEIDINKEKFQIGIDMLIRLKHYEDALIILLKRNMLREAMIFIHGNKIDMNDRIMSIIRQYVQITKENKKIIYQYIIA